MSPWSGQYWYEGHMDGRVELLGYLQESSELLINFL